VCLSACSADAARIIPAAVVAMKLLLSIMVMSPSIYTSTSGREIDRAQYFFFRFLTTPLNALRYHQVPGDPVIGGGIF